MSAQSPKYPPEHPGADDVRPRRLSLGHHALPPKDAPSRVAAVDFGTARIGIAISDAARTVSSPYANYTRRALEADAKYFRELGAREEIGLWVVGLPVHLSGREGRLSAEARRFAEWLARVTGAEVVLFDERFTTSEAQELLAQGGLTRRQRKRRLDMLAAQVMLRAFLESPTRVGDDAPRPLDDAP